MNNKLKKNIKGFTLIEALLYIGLFSIIITGGLAGAYQIIQSTDRTSSKTILEQDANFILRKIDWALIGATSLATPNTQTLTIARSPDNINFTLSSTDFQKDGVALNSSSIKISDLSFQLIALGGKQGVNISFTGTTFDDKLTQTFSITKYLR